MTLAARQSLWKNQSKMTTIDWNFAGSPMSYATAPYSIRGLTNFSLGAWVYLEDKDVASQIFGYGSTGSWGGFSVGSHDRGKFYWRGGSNGGDAVQFVGQIELSKWTHLCMVHTASNTCCYIDGQLATTLPYANMGTQISTRFKMVRGDYGDSDGIGHGYTGCSVATVFCTRKALSASNVAEIASVKKPISKIPLINDSSLMFGYDVLDGTSLDSIPNIVKGGEPLTIIDGQYSQWSRAFS